jgi:hypothetical protein
MPGVSSISLHALRRTRIPLCGGLPCALLYLAKQDYLYSARRRSAVTERHRGKDVIRVSTYRVYREGLFEVSAYLPTERYAGGFPYLIVRLAAYPYSIMRGFTLRFAISRKAGYLYPAGRLTLQFLLSASPCALPDALQGGVRR